MGLHFTQFPDLDSIDITDDTYILHTRVQELGRTSLLPFYCRELCDNVDEHICTE